MSKTALWTNLRAHLMGDHWEQATSDRGQHVHVLPLDDIITHNENDDFDCFCGPTTEPVVRDDGSIGWLLTHHALDGRESHE